MDKNKQAFLALVGAGLWEKEALILPYGEIDFSVIYKLAEDQTVVGIVAAGLEHTVDERVLQKWALTFAGSALQVEKRNIAMNKYVARLIEMMRGAGIYTLLVKGPAVAQCYERPLWRPSGDIDLLLSKDNYYRAVEFLKKIYPKNKCGGRYSKEYAFYTEQWMIEIHGVLRTGLTTRMDRAIDEVQDNIFYDGRVRTWLNGNVQVFLPAPENDVFLVFTHFIKHFYKEGACLRQICDWCRILWTFRNELNVTLLEEWLRNAGLETEWKSFAALVVDYLRMPKEAMPFYCDDRKWHKKGEQIMQFILDWSHGKILDTLVIASIFPWHTFRFMPAILWNINWLKIKERLCGQ